MFHANIPVWILDRPGRVLQVSKPESDPKEEMRRWHLDDLWRSERGYLYIIKGQYLIPVSVNSITEFFRRGLSPDRPAYWQVEHYQRVQRH